VRPMRAISQPEFSWTRHPELWVAGSLGLATMALIPLAPQGTPVAPGLVPVAAALILAADFVAAALLLRPGASANPRRPWLAASFAYSGLMALAFLGTYPGLLAPQGVLGGPGQAYAWIRLTWQGGSLLCLLLALGLPDRAFPAAARRAKTQDGGGGTGFPWLLMAPTGLAGISLVGAELAAELGPPPLHGTSYAGVWQAVAGLLLAAALALAVAAIRRYGRATQLERWLTTTALVGSASLLVTVAAERRYSLGWDAAWVVWAATAGMAALVCVSDAMSEENPAASRRHSLTHAISGLEQSASLEGLAVAICAEVARHAGVDYAALVRFDSSGRGVLVGSCPQPSSRELHLGSLVAEPSWRRQVEARAGPGGLVEELPQGVPAAALPGALLAQLRRRKLRAIAHVPVRLDGRVEWVLSAARRGDSERAAVADLTALLPSLGDAAAMASVLLAATSRSLSAGERQRDRIEAVLRQHSFHPVFQPIVATDSGRVIGHEALTRFEAGAPPDQIFGEAAAAGLGTRLELACLKAAIAAARALPANSGWLSLNASPELLLGELRRLKDLLTGADRPVVLEVTEHAVIDSYSRLRAALAELPAGVEIAVDDAGAGFASLRHVVELRPAYVKLDISLVRGLDQDPVRQAMVTGLVAFARRSGSALIAEGVETETELAILRSLQVGYVQGFLLGRPRPAASGGRVTAGSAAPGAPDLRSAR